MCAVIDSPLDEIMAYNDVITFMVVVANEIDDWSLRKVTT